MSPNLSPRSQGATWPAGKPGSQSLALEITLPANQQPGAYELVVEVSSSDGGAPRNLLTREIQVSAEKPLMFVETDKPGEQIEQAGVSLCRTGGAQCMDG